MAAEEVSEGKTHEMTTWFSEGSLKSQTSKSSADSVHEGPQYYAMFYLIGEPGFGDIYQCLKNSNLLARAVGYGPSIFHIPPGIVPKPLRNKIITQRKIFYNKVQRHIVPKSHEDATTKFVKFVQQA